MGKNTYQELRRRINMEIEILKQKLEAMDMDQKKNPNDFGYVGNCCHILDRIEDINSFLERF